MSSFIHVDEPKNLSFARGKKVNETPLLEEIDEEAVLLFGMT